MFRVIYEWRVPVDKMDEFQTVWRSRQDWELFWENSNPEKMQKMREIAERISVESFDEIEDRTKS
ncbi:hypothetical protein HJ019_22720 [Vibrio parahaemolyticus]|nr:hypothetical protein [Vibrio parahaemolyticus]